MVLNNNLLLSRGKLKYLGFHKNVKAATLLITVLISVIAASIAMTLVQVVMQNSTSNGETVRFVDAKNQALDNLYLTISEINQSPLKMFSEVLTNEAPRTCDFNGSQVNPGGDWLSKCGLDWEYQNLAGLEEYILIKDVTSGSREVTLVSVVKSGKTKVGYQAKITLGMANQPILYSGSDFNFAELTRNTTLSNLSGTFYSTGDLENWGDISSIKSLFLAENTFSPLPNNTDEVSGFEGTKFASGKPNSSRHIYGIRNFVDQSLDNTTYRSSLTSLVTLSCNQEASENITINSTTLLTKFCLQSGQLLTNTSGESVLVPSATGFVIVPESASTLGVYYPTGDTYDPVASCGNCDAPALIADQYDLLREDGPLPPNPGFIGSYTKLGSFNNPVNNLVYSASNLTIGFCGSGFLDGVCNSFNGSNKSVFGSNLIFIAGNLNAPRDIIIGQSVSGPNNTQINLVASNSVVLPYWATSPGGSLLINANIFTYANNNSIKSLPQASTNLNLTAGQLLYIKGQIYGSAIETSIDPNLFESFKLEPFKNLNQLFTPKPDLKWHIKQLNRVLPINII